MTDTGVATGAPIEIRTPDDLTIRGERWDGGERYAVLVHDRGDDLDSVRAIGSGLVAAGFTTVAIDRIGHGASDDRPEGDRGGDLGEDLCAVVDSLSLEQGVYLVGVGEAAADCLYAAGRVEPSLVVLVSPRETGQIPADVLGGDQSPTLLIIGAHDQALEGAARRLRAGRPGAALLVRLPTMDQAAALIWGPYGQQVVNHLVGYARQVEPRARSRG